MSARHFSRILSMSVSLRMVAPASSKASLPLALPSGQRQPYFLDAQKPKPTQTGECRGLENAHKELRLRPFTLTLSKNLHSPLSSIRRIIIFSGASPRGHWHGRSLSSSAFDFFTHCPTPGLRRFTAVCVVNATTLSDRFTRRWP